MKANRNGKTIAGWVLHGLVGGIMILAGSATVFGLFPLDQLAKMGLSLQIERCWPRPRKCFLRGADAVDAMSTTYEQVAEKETAQGITIKDAANAAGVSH